MSDCEDESQSGSSNDCTSKFSKLLKIKDDKISSQEAQIKQLETKISSLNFQIRGLQKELLVKNELEKQVKILEEKIQSKNSEIERISKNLKDITSEYSIFKTNEARNYTYQLTKLQNHIDSDTFKIDNCGKVEKLNDKLYAHILELENLLVKFNENQKETIQKIELDHQKRIVKLKKDMLDYLKSENTTFSVNRNKQGELNSKLTFLHITELTRELEYQTKYMETLLIERQNFKNKICNLKCDLKVFMQVTQLLEEKNKKYEKELNKLSMKINEDDEDGKNNDSKLNQTERNFFYKKIKFPKGPKKIPNFNLNCMNNNNKNYNSNDLELLSSATINLKSLKSNNDNNINSITDINNIKTDKNSLNSTESIRLYLTKQLIAKEKIKENYKSRYDTAKAKLDFINQKYYNIFKIFEYTLDKICSENSFIIGTNQDQGKNNKGITMLDLNKIKNGDFALLSESEKYSIGLLMMKIILPLIDEDLIDLDKFNAMQTKSNTKFFFNNYTKMPLSSQGGVRPLFTAKKNMQAYGEKKSLFLKSIDSNCNINTTSLRTNSSEVNGMNVTNNVSQFRNSIGHRRILTDYSNSNRGASNTNITDTKILMNCIKINSKE